LLLDLIGSNKVRRLCAAVVDLVGSKSGDFTQRWFFFAVGFDWLKVGRLCAAVVDLVGSKSGDFAQRCSG
jgi:hypothetical protein